MEIDHEMFFTVILLLASADSRRAVVSCKRKYVNEVLVNCLRKSVDRLTDLFDVTIAVDQFNIQRDTTDILLDLLKCIIYNVIDYLSYI